MRFTFFPFRAFYSPVHFGTSFFFRFVRGGVHFGRGKQESAQASGRINDNNPSHHITFFFFSLVVNPPCPHPPNKLELRGSCRPEPPPRIKHGNLIGAVWVRYFWSCRKRCGGGRLESESLIARPQILTLSAQIYVHIATEVPIATRRGDQEGCS